MEASILGEDGNNIVSESNLCQKQYALPSHAALLWLIGIARVRVPALTARTDVAVLAARIIEKCKYIHPSQQGEVEQLLLFLQKRNQTIGGCGCPWLKARVSSRILPGHDAKTAEKSETQRQLMASSAKQSQAQLSDIDSYVEMLYDDTKRKIQGTAMILQVSSCPA